MNKATINQRNTQMSDIKTIMDKNYAKEVFKQGWMIPFLASIIKFIKNGSLIPIGCASQWTIVDQGKKIAKN